MPSLDFNASALNVDDILITDELDRRPPRRAEYLAESSALNLLAEELAASPDTVLQKLADAMVHLCIADSAGISILEENGGSKLFRWHAVAGTWAPFLGETIPVDESLCGIVVAKNRVLLFRTPHKYFPAPDIEPPICEVLLIPFHVGKTPVGTLWALAQDPARKFDAEDVRLMQNLSRFASAAFQTVGALKASESAREKLVRTVRGRTTKLSVANTKLRKQARERAIYVHDLQRSQDRQKLLISELQHRTRNLLALVRAVSKRTAESCDSMDQFQREFDSRLGSLSRAQGLLSREGGPSVSLASLIHTELSAHGANIDGVRLRVTGPDVLLLPKAVQVLALGIHELATNTVNHGALSQEQARLAITWTVNDRLHLSWHETGVLRAHSQPYKRGFGLDLIENALPYDLGARTSFEFTVDGVRCMLHIPLGNIPAE